jgi:hypothetical protein
VPLFSGPPRDVVFGMAQNFAELAREIHRLPRLEEPARQEAIDKLTADGQPTTLPDLVERAAANVVGHKLGWFRRNQFFGSLQGFCILLDMPRPDAAYLVSLIKARVKQETPATARKWAIFAG